MCPGCFRLSTPVSLTFETKDTNWVLQMVRYRVNAAGSAVGILYGRRDEGVWSSSNLQLSVFINENMWI